MATSISGDSNLKSELNQGCGSALSTRGPISVSSNKHPNDTGRLVLNWWQSNQLNQASGPMYYLKTNLWAGGGPSNTMYIMGGFRITGYRYTAPANCFALVQFHNWSGSYYGYSVSHMGDYTPTIAMSVSSDGYCVLGLGVDNQYVGYSIDLIQHGIYPVRDIRVVSEGWTAP